MGQAGSSLVDCVCDGDIQSLKSSLQQRKQQHKATSEADNNDSNNSDGSTEDEWLLEVEEAMHAVVGMEIHSAQQFQQLQIALELLFQAQPQAWATHLNNAVKWTGAHRACVTGNLSFLTFVFQHFDQFDVQERDTFGLFPIDLVPPELLRTPEEMALDAAQEPRVGTTKEPIFPATARSRRNLALQILRQKKNEAQARCIDQFLFNEHPSQTSAAKSVPTEKASGDGKSDSKPNAQENQEPKANSTTGEHCMPVDNQQEHHERLATTSRVSTEDLVANGAYYIAFESSRDHLVPAMTSTSSATATSMGEVHERSTPLRLKYRFPRIDEFLNGYFQLIWRDGVGQPRSEEPHYDTHVLMRDEMFLDPQCLEFFDDDCDEGSGLNLQEAHAGGARALGTSVETQARQEPKRERQNLSHCHRRLDDPNPVLQGCFPFDVSRIPHDAVCHVLFVACDRHLMKRTVVLSTEGIALRDANDDYDFLKPRNLDEEDEDEDFDDEEDSDEEHSGFIFHVAGEAFSHANPVFSGKSFDGIEDFEKFVKGLRSKSDQQLRKNQGTVKKKNDEDVQSEVVKPNEADGGGGARKADASDSEPVTELREPESTCEVTTKDEAQDGLSLGQALEMPQPELCEQQPRDDEDEEDNQKEHEHGKDKEVEEEAQEIHVEDAVRCGE